MIEAPENMPVYTGSVNAGMFSKPELELMMEVLYKARRRSIVSEEQDRIARLHRRFELLSGHLKA